MPTHLIIILTLLLNSCSNSNNLETSVSSSIMIEEPIKFNISDAYKRDSILVDNTVEFYTYSDSVTRPIPSVRFNIKVTNLGSQPIPNLTRVTNRIEHLELYYNNKNSADLNISNEMEGDDWPWSIEKNESDTFNTGALIVKYTGLFYYGDTIKAKWVYMGIESKVKVVDLINRKVLEH